MSMENTGLSAWAKPIAGLAIVVVTLSACAGSAPASPAPPTSIPTPVGLRAAADLPDPNVPPEDLSDANLVLNDKCVRAEYYIGQPSTIRGGNLDLVVEANSMLDFTMLAADAANLVCSQGVSRQSVDTLVSQARERPGIAVQRYSWSGQ